MSLLSHLQRTASGHSFIRIEGGADVFAEEPADSLLDSWHSRGPADDLHGVDVVPTQFCNNFHTNDFFFLSFN